MLVIAIDSESVSEVVTGFGVKGVSAEKVASDACDEAQAYMAAGVPVGIHLADQLLIPMAMAGGGTFRTLTPTRTHGHECRRDSTFPRCVRSPSSTNAMASIE